MKLTKKQLLDFAKILKAKEIKISDRNAMDMCLWSVAYSYSSGKCTGRIYENSKGVFFVAKTHKAVVYVDYL